MAGRMIAKLADYIVSPLALGTRANYEAVKAGRTRLRRYEGLWGLPEPFVASLMDGPTGFSLPGNRHPYYPPYPF